MKNLLFHNEPENSRRVLYTPELFAKKNLIYLQETGELTSDKDYISRRNSHRSFLFFIVLSGSGKIGYDGQEWSVSRGNCVFLDCGSEYFHQSDENGWTLKWAHFYGSTLGELYGRYIKLGGKNCFKCNMLTEYEAILDEIYAVASSDVHNRDMKIYEKLVSLLTMLTDECFDREDGRDNIDMARDLSPVKKYIDEAYMSRITLDELAEKFYINKFYLARLFKKQFGMSVVNYILHVRISHSKHFLRFTDLSVDSIGAKCGFGSGNYFTRAFRKIEGVTPGQFRKTWRGR